VDRDNSIAQRRGERSPLADRLARQAPLPDGSTGRRFGPPRMRPRESAALVVVVAAALVSALATSGAGWGIPLRAADPVAGTEVAVIEAPTGEQPTDVLAAPPADPPNETPAPAPTATVTATPAPADEATEAPTPDPTSTASPVEPTAPPPPTPTAEATAPNDDPAPATPEPGISDPATPDPATPEPTGAPTSTAPPDPDPTDVATPTASEAPEVSPPIATEEPTQSPDSPIASPPTEVAAEDASPVATEDASPASEATEPPEATKPPEEDDPVASPAATPPAEAAGATAAPVVPVVLALSANPPATADPGSIVELTHTLALAAPVSDEIRLSLRLTTRLGWPVTLGIAGQPLPLLDGDGDGAVDLVLAAGQTKVSLLVRAELPAGALAAEREAIELTAWPAGEAPGAAVTVADEIVVNRILIVRVEPDTTRFGRVAPDGSLDPSVPGVTSIVDREGSWYVKERAVVLSVTTNAPVTLTCATEANEANVAGRLAWRPTGSETWTTFGALDGENAVCLPPLAPGVHLFVFDVRLRVNWTDPPGTIATDVTLTPIEPETSTAAPPDPTASR
jgi:hypothetical protein